MFRSFTYDFRCAREVLEIQAAWLGIGPYHWQAFDNEQYGIYIVARVPDMNLRIRVLGQAPNYSLEIDFDVEPKVMNEMQSRLFVNLFDKLLPGVGATDVRDTSRETAG